MNIWQEQDDFHRNFSLSFSFTLEHSCFMILHPTNCSNSDAQLDIAIQLDIELILLQIWNHDFFWESMKPDGGGKPSGDLLELIQRDFGSYDRFIEEFKAAASKQFGSGWAWLACEKFTSFFSCFFPRFVNVKLPYVMKHVSVAICR